MTQLNQIIAIEQGVKERATRTLTDAYHLIQKSEPLHGITRTYQPKDDDGDQLPPESTKVQINAHTVIDGLTESLVRLFDVTFTKDATNTVAKADVVVDGKTLVSEAPVPYLLFLEKQLIGIRTFILHLPVLDPAVNWDLDATSGVYRATPVETTKTKKVPRVLVKYPPTTEHPAQVDTYNEDVLVGTWTTVKFSGALPQADITAMRERVDAALEATKQAREQANTIQVTDRKAGAAVLDYIFGGAQG